MPNTKPKSVGQKKTNSSLIILGLIVIVAVIGTYFIFQNRSGSNKSGSGGSNNTSQSDQIDKASNAVGVMSLSPDSSSVSMGKSFTVQIYEDSQGDKVNAVQANLTYPTNLLDFVSIDTSSSAFGVTAPSHGGSGTVVIARGSVTPVIGKQLVAAVTFKPKSSSGNANIDFASGSAVLRSTDNKNTLNSTTGATYTLTQ